MNPTDILIPSPVHSSRVNAHQKYKPGIVSFSNQLIAPCPSGTNIASVMRCGLSVTAIIKIGPSSRHSGDGIKEIKGKRY